MDLSKRRTLLAVIILAWLLLVTALYYVTHKPFDPAFAIQQIVNVWRITVAGLIVSVAGGLGRKINQLEGLHPLAQISLDAALGFGIFAILILIIGSFWGVTALPLWIIFALSMILLRKEILSWWRGWAFLISAWKATDRLNRSLGFYIIAVMGLSLFTAIAPPVKFDALVYHLTLPQAYLNAGKISYLPWLMMSGMPQTAEMLYTWAIGLSGGLSTATILSWSFGLIAAVGLFGLVKSHLGDRPAWIALACLFSGYSLVVSLSWGYVEWLTLLFGLAFLTTIDWWSRHGGWMALCLAGVYAGFALGTKVPVGFLAVIGVLIVLWQARRTGENPIRAAFVFGGAVIVASLPWWVKNLITTGNPFYPLLFPSGAMTEFRLTVFQNAPTWGNLLDIFFLPIRATYLGVEGGEGYSFSIGPLLLGLAVFASIGSQNLSDRQRNFRKIAGVMTGLGIIIWVIGNQFSGFLVQTRMYLAIVPAICFLAALGYETITSIQLHNLRLHRIVNAVIFLVISLNLIEVGSGVVGQGSVEYDLGIHSGEEYLRDNLGSYAVAMETVDALPESEKILLLVEPRSLYCLPKCRPDETLDRWSRAYEETHDPAKILADWKAEGFTYLLYYKTGAEFLRDYHDINHTEEQWQALDAFLGTLPDPVNINDVYVLYPLSQ